MTTSEIIAAGSINGGGEVNYLQTELSSLGIECKKRNKFNDKEELEALAAAIKEDISKITRLLIVILAIEKSTNHTLST
jgi:hypothetical protein